MDGIWFVADVRRILVALASAGDERGPEYKRALSDVGLAFGVLLARDATTASWQDAVKSRAPAGRREVLLVEQDARR